MYRSNYFLKTILGEVKLFVNHREVSYNVIELSRATKMFHVQGRYKINYQFDAIPNDSIVDVKCLILFEPNMNVEWGAETEEYLALNSFFYRNIKLCIGTLGDNPDIEYIYLNNGLELRCKPILVEINFYITWLELMDADKEYNYPNFAADPSVEYL